MILVLKAGREPVADWLAAFAAKMPELEVRIWPDVGDRAEVDVLFTTRIAEGEVARFPNLRFVTLIAAGADRLLADPGIPASLPIVRSVNPQRATTMAAWVLYHVIRHHRDFAAHEADQADGRWQLREYLPPGRVRIGVMGLGDLGGAVARALVGLGYGVAGWSRRPRNIAGVEGFAGPRRFARFLARSDILVAILPFTPDTDGLLDARALAALPRGAYVINSGRGELIVEQDLLAAIGSGHLSGAALDVFRVEPLPADHAFWAHPKITMTPHNSCMASAWHSVDVVIENIRRLEAGQPLAATIDRAAGY